MRQSALTLLLLSISALAMETSNCKTITCSNTEAASDGNCVTVLDNTVTLNPCPDGYYCQDLDQFRSSDSHSSSTCTANPTETEETCPTSHENDVYTYMYCCVDADCASNKCDVDDNECEGIAEGGACTENEACEPDLYCESGICVPTKAVNQYCNSDYECDTGYGCYSSAYCMEYFSLADGKSPGNSKFCKSGTMRDSICDSVSIYSGGILLSEPWECTIGQKCSYKWTIANTKYQEDKMCECAGQGSGETTGYCPIRGIYAITNFTDTFYEKFQYDDSDCSGKLAHLTDLSGGDLYDLVYCNSIDQDGLDYYYAMQKNIEAWSLYSSGQIDSCAEEMGIFEPSEDIDSWDSAEFLILSGILILFN